MVSSTSQATPEGFAISCRHARLCPGMQTSDIAEEKIHRSYAHGLNFELGLSHPMETIFQDIIM